MNQDILKGKWKQLQGRVQSTWGKLTNDEVDRIDGNAEELIGLIQERYGYERDRAEREVETFVNR